MREWIAVYLKGIFMGAADAVPGISGGTIALITGIYERLINALTAINPIIIRSLVQPHKPEERRKVKEMLIAMDIKFLLILAAGLLTAVITVTQIVGYMLQTVPGITYGFFFGLIAAAAFVLYSEVSITTLRLRIVAIVGFAIAFVITGLSQNALPSTIGVIFVTGAIAITAMILPGISGSLFLLILGQYEFLINILRKFIIHIPDALTGNITPITRPASFVAVFLIGALLGLLTIANIIKWALVNYRTATITFLISLMVGALRKPIDEIEAAVGIWTPKTIVGITGAMLIGAVLVFVLDYYTGTIEY